MLKRRAFTSIRSRIIAWSAAIVAIALATFGLGAALYLRSELSEEIDAEVRAEAKDFFEAVSTRPVDWQNPWQVEMLFQQSNRMRYVDIWNKDGQLLYRSPSLKQHSIFPSRSTKTLQNIRWNRKEIRYGIFRKGGLVIALGKEMGEVDEILYELLAAYAVALPVVILVAGIGAWWIARKALSPIELIASRAEEISATQLDKRLPELPGDSELGRLARILNSTFARLAKSFEEVTRFTSDASHELKTPLSVMRVELENAITTREFSSAELKLLGSLLDQTTLLSRIVDNLLFLSRVDNRGVELIRENVNLATLVEELAEDLELLAEPLHVRIERHIPQTLPVSGDILLLRRLVMNLLDNAVKYNHPKGHVAIAGSVANEKAVLLSVRNTGPGIASGTEEKVFERFYRGDAAHSDTVTGHGLGLSIAREIARAHGGDLQLVLATPDWTEFHLSLPLNPAPSDDMAESRSTFLVSAGF